MQAKCFPNEHCAEIITLKEAFDSRTFMHQDAPQISLARRIFLELGEKSVTFHPVAFCQCYLHPQCLFGYALIYLFILKNSHNSRRESVQESLSKELKPQRQRHFWPRKCEAGGEQKLLHCFRDCHKLQQSRRRLLRPQTHLANSRAWASSVVLSYLKSSLATCKPGPSSTPSSLGVNKADKQRQPREGTSEHSAPCWALFSPCSPTQTRRGLPEGYEHLM